MTYQEIEKNAERARRIMHLINPNAKCTYSLNKFNKKLCNGLYLGDCQGICTKLAEEYVAAGNKPASTKVRTIPLFVFATLEHAELIEFVELWEAANE